MTPIIWSFDLIWSHTLIWSRILKEVWSYLACIYRLLSSEGIEPCNMHYSMGLFWFETNAVEL
jgi:hypothetical protein